MTGPIPNRGTPIADSAEDVAYRALLEHLAPSRDALKGCIACNEGRCPRGQELRVAVREARRQR